MMLLKVKKYTILHKKYFFYEFLYLDEYCKSFMT